MAGHAQILTKEGRTRENNKNQTTEVPFIKQISAPDADLNKQERGIFVILTHISCSQ